MRCAEAQLLLAPLQDEFAQRYYRWCLEESDREVEADFPSIRAIKSHVAFLFLDFAETCSPEEIRSLMIGRIKQFNPRARELANDPITPHEETILTRFLAFFRDEVILHGQRLSRVRIPRKESEIRERELAGETSTEINPKELRQVLLKSLEPVLGKPERAGYAGLNLAKRIGSWHLTTSLDWAGHAQLNYGHLICARHRTDRIDLCPTDLLPSLCPMSWCGIHPSTAFDLIEASELRSVGETVARFSSRVLEIVPGLLSGLEHRLPDDIDDALQISLSPA